MIFKDVVLYLFTIFVSLYLESVLFIVDMTDKLYTQEARSTSIYSYTIH